MSYEEVMAWARAHYNEGGDGIYECWNEQTYKDYVQMFGVPTEKTLQIMADDEISLRREYTAMAGE